LQESRQIDAWYKRREISSKPLIYMADTMKKLGPENDPDAASTAKTV
jgi:hypothetical protein